MSTRATGQFFIKTMQASLNPVQTNETYRKQQTLVRDEGYEFVFITAFPADQSYLDRIRRGANVIERRGQK